ncbi:MAG: EAL domain-containing protein [Pseudohongiella sp.]|nr:EAL domain-containing protein [Pseudohongiella sp.]
MEADINKSASSLTRGTAMTDFRLGLGELCVQRLQDDPLLHRLLSLSSDMFWQENADGVCEAVLSYSESTQAAAHQLFGQRLIDVAFEPERPDLNNPRTLTWRHYLDSLVLRQAFRQVDCVIKLKDGNSCYLQITGAPQFDAQGKFLGYECVAVDTTRERNDEINLKRFRAAMDMSLDMIYLVDRDTLSFVDVNDTACRNAGLTRDEILRLGPSKIMGFSRAELDARYNQLIELGRSSRFERRITLPNGSSSIVEIHSRATLINGRWLIIGVSRDVTARKEAELKAFQLQQLFSALSLTNEAILRATSVDTLYQQATRAAVSSELFTISSVLVPNERGHFYAVAKAGHADNSMKKVRVIMDTSQPEGRGMTTMAMLEGKAQYSNDYQADVPNAAWRENAIEHNINSAAALPLLRHKKPVAVMLFYANQKNVFDAQTQSILQSMADNMSFALDSFANAAEQAVAAERIRQNEERFRSLTNLSSDFYWEMDADLRFTLYEGRIRGDANKTAVNHAIGQHLWNLPSVTPDIGGWRHFRRMLEKQQAFREFEFSFTNTEGTTYHLTLSGEPIRDSAGLFSGYRGITRDITSKKKVANHIKHLATHDTLTGLPNRVMFSELVGHAIRNATRYKDQRFAVLFIDLDRFKAVNDTYGHHTGDQLLAEVAKRLTTPLRSSDIVARLGGDEFVIMLQRVNDKEQAALIANNILQVFSVPITIEQREFMIGASIGISLFGVDANTEESLMNHADTAMYAAKEEGRNNFRLYSADLHQHNQERAGLAVELRHALKRGELSLNYQAKVDVDTGQVVGVEALLRWRHPELGDISPNHFIPIAEDNGLIVPIGEWVMATACQQVLSWQQQGLPALSLAVNLSARQFNHPDLPAYIQQMLADNKFPAEQLELEITESLVVQNPERTIRLMQEMKKTGIRFALDDFGTGYSSLGQLRHYPIDTLKIDRAFIKDLDTSREDQAISKAIISMSKTLGLTVVAEGVENSRQLAFLRHYQCDIIQGYFCHKPSAADEFAAWFKLQLTNPK